MITHCKKCEQQLERPVSENTIGILIGICDICKLDLEQEEEKTRLYKVPNQDIPYKP